MVLLHQNQNPKPSRKRPSSAFVPPFAQSAKLPKSTTTTTAVKEKPQVDVVSSSGSPSPIDKTDRMLSVLADAGCTLIDPSGPPCLPPDLHKLRHHLHHVLSVEASLRSDFLSGFSSYIQSSDNLRRILLLSHGGSCASARSESLVRVLLLVPSIQLDLQNLLLEKLPEYFDMDPSGGFGSSSSLRLDEDLARLILNQFRWVDFLVNSEAFTDKLLQVLSICPLRLKKEIIGSLPEIIGDQNYKVVVDSLEQMLQEDSAVIVPVLDAFSNLNLDDLLREQVITIALSCIRTVDAEDMPCLLRFLLLSVSPSNAGRIISQIREQLKFVGVSNSRMAQHNKLKGKSVVDSLAASILDALKSSLRFRNMLCQEILNELKCLENARDHKMIDIWLLMLIYTNSESMQKSVEKLLKKKIITGSVQEVMFDQCICGNKELVQDYFSSFVSLSEYLLACKEQKAREFGIHMYICLFEEFVDTYSRQEVLGALISHVGSGISFEVTSALKAMLLLASTYSQELIPLSSHITGILDYLECFCIENLHKVYEIFSLLTMSARSSAESLGSSIGNELLMIARKQVSSSDLKYKKMGLIGSLKLVSFLGDENSTSCLSSSLKPNYEEALELLKKCLDSCKQSPLALILFYDELIIMLDCRILHPTIMEWVGKHVGEFESKFLSDLERGQLPSVDSYSGLEGELWMNLDGDISPICLSILPLVSSSLRNVSLQILPVNFLLLSKIERLTNQGSLGGIDALLGCPLHLPSSKFFSGPAGQSLTEKQKEVLCLSLFYAANWIRELVNAFCTQIAGRFDSISQETKEEIISKLLKRLRNLVFLECLLNNVMKSCSLSLPELYPQVDSSSCFSLAQPNSMGNVEKKNEHMRAKGCPSQDKKKKGRSSKASVNPDNNDSRTKQPTILDVWRKVGALPCQEVQNEDSHSISKASRTGSVGHPAHESNESTTVEVSAVPKVLDAQRYKFRPLLAECFSILAFSRNEDSCCPDPAAELHLHLYILRDLHNKLDHYSPSSKQISSRCLSNPAGCSQTTVTDFLRKISTWFPTLKRHLRCAVNILKEEGAENCQEHWKIQSALAGNPDITDMVISESSVASSVFKEILFCFSKMLNLPDIEIEKSILSDLLMAFQPEKISDFIFSGMQVVLPPGNIQYLYCGAYSFLEGILDEASTFSFRLACEVLLTLESVIASVRKLLNNSLEGSDRYQTGTNQGLLPSLCKRLGTSAQKLLSHNWDSTNLTNGWKSKGEMVQKILHIYLEHSESTLDSLDELACLIMPQVCSGRGEANDDGSSFPSLCSATFVVWYRELHEENIATLNKLVREVGHLEKHKVSFQQESIERLLNKLRQSVKVLVSLINLCRTNDKVIVHAMAVKYGGKFIDSFLRGFDFLRIQFQTHNELIIQMIKDLQKATRTIQALCSEAKGMKQTVVTGKIPGTKRSLERFLFHVKALLYTTSNGCTFWMGNLKHKDLMGQVLSSQAYVEDESENVDQEFAETVPVDQTI